MKIDISALVTDPNFAPRAWESQIPDTAWSHKPPIEESADLRRIVGLPRRAQPEPRGPRAEALIELMTTRYSNGRAAGAGCDCRAKHGRECIVRLRLAQAWALYEIGLKNGTLAPIGVGHGKTMLDLLAALAFRECRTAVLLVPPSLVTQLIADYGLVGNHFRLPSIMVHGRREWANVVPGTPVLHVLPYSQLSQHTSTLFLENLAPDVMIADEVHLLRHADAVRTARVLRFFSGHASTRFAGWSGSITDSSVKDYAHLAALALRDGSPLPLHPEVVEDWARAIDPGDNPAPAGALLGLCEPGEHLHSGYHRRLVETMGVVATTEPSIDCGLDIQERQAPPLPAEIRSALADLRNEQVRPDGEELVDPLSVNRCALELACGFFYRWKFPRGEPKAVIEEWFKARKIWRKEMRLKLMRREPHLDSPKLAAMAAARAWGDRPNPDDLPEWKADGWPRWRAAKGTVKPETEAVRMDPFLAQDAAEWARTHRGIVWYQRKAFGEWVAELSGCPLHGGGPNAGPRLAAERGNRSIVASIKSHGTGRDGLQFLFKDQLIANPSPSSSDWEQLLGRLHRVGQRAKVVAAAFYRHTPEMRAHVDVALRRALYVETTLGAGQKLNVGWGIEMPDRYVDTL